jgi:charged multivesicular body protein 4A/B
MSGVWGWFGGGAAAKKKDTPKNAILDLRTQLDMLQKREKHLMNQMADQDAIARKNINTNKNGSSPPSHDHMHHAGHPDSLTPSLQQLPRLRCGGRRPTNTA